MNTGRVGRLVAIALPLVVVPLWAQQDLVHDSNTPVAPLLTGDRSVSELGAGVTVLDVDSLLRESPVRTLSELLTGRVPGLEVLASSGTLGTGSRILMRGATSVWTTGAPQIYVDGVRVNDEPATLMVPVGGQTTSRIDDIAVERIATIAILPGPAAAALYGTDAANGVLLITSKRGIPGGSQMRAFTSQGLVTQPLDFPINYRAIDSSGAVCRVVGDVASGVCRLVTGNVLDSPASSPFRNGYLRQYGVSASGGSGNKRYALAGQWDGFGGVYGLPGTEQARLGATGGLHPEVLNPNYLRRADVRGSGQLLAGDRADVAVTAGYFQSDLRLPINDNSVAGILSNGLLGGDSTLGGWGRFLPGEIFQVATSQQVERVTGSLAATWRPLARVSVSAVLGLDHTYQLDGQLQRPGEGPFANPAFSSVAQGRWHDTRYTGAVTAAAALEPSPELTLRTTIGVHYFKDRVELFDSSSTVFSGGSSISTRRIRGAGSTVGLMLQQQLAWRDRLFITGALRRDATKRFGVGDPAAVYPSIGVAWRGPTPPASAFLRSWRLRAAYGAAGREVAILGHRPERTREIEGGVDAELFRGRITLNATVYEKRSMHVLGATAIAPPFGLSDVTAISNKGVELAVWAGVVQQPGVTWSVGLSAWGNRDRVVTTGPFPILFNAGVGLYQSGQVGLPLGSYIGRPIISYADANGDGLLDPSEVQVQLNPPEFAFVGTPFPTQGASLSSTLTLRRRVRIAGLLEYRGGNSLLNGTEQVRCLQGSCRAASDPSTPLVDQMPLAAMWAGTDAGWVQSARFLKLRELSVALVAPPGWAAHLGAADMTLTVAGRNLVTWTRYKGLDPEVNAHGSEGLVVEDLFTQPLPRYWTARLDLTF